MSKKNPRLSVTERNAATRTLMGSGVPYVDADLLPLKPVEMEDLKGWLRGQTLPVVEGVRLAIYPWDLERWAKGLPIID